MKGIVRNWLCGHAHFAHMGGFGLVWLCPHNLFKTTNNFTCDGERKTKQPAANTKLLILRAFDSTAACNFCYSVNDHTFIKHSPKTFSKKPIEIILEL